VEALIEALSDASAWVREAAAQALGLIGDSRAAAPLAKALQDVDRHVRKRAASALILLPPSPEAFAALSEAAVNDTSSAVRRYAVEALGWFGDAAAVPTLIDALGDPESSEVRAAAARHLGDLASSKAVSALAERFKDADVDVRWAAVRSVGRLGGTEAESELRQVITSGGQDAQVVQAARTALRTMGRGVPLSEEAKRLFQRDGST
ncbi:MAG: HEAT repeat domain-containing protein, partial [Armatimonadota bacterium]|jgi:HEAT repeat protein